MHLCEVTGELIVLTLSRECQCPQTWIDYNSDFYFLSWGPQIFAPLLFTGRHVQDLLVLVCTLPKNHGSSL